MSAGLVAPLLHKVHTSAVCLIPPTSAWPAIQSIRCVHDKGFVRWPPHVNLLYPFLEDSQGGFGQAAARAALALRATQPFEVALEALCFFDHGRSCTLWLEPRPAEELAAVQRALAGAFPGCSDLSSDPRRGIAAFTPHLSLGQWRSAGDVQAAAAALGAGWAPLRFQSGGVALISRKSHGEPFTVRYVVPFGGGEPQEVNQPYIATVGHEEGGACGGAAMGPELADVGGAPGVWSFAYGANMSPAKLKRRGVAPLRSLRGRLPGWRLCFTHRGGMGNIFPLPTDGGDGSASGGSPGDVHGVLHLLTPADYAELARAEHEYRPVVVEVECSGPGGSRSVRAVAFVTPAARCIAEGLPPIGRYLALLREGAREFELPAAYVAWLDGTASVEQRGPEYYTSVDGSPLEGLPKIRVGSASGRGGGRGRRRGSGRPGGGGRAPAG